MSRSIAGRKGSARDHLRLAASQMTPDAVPFLKWAGGKSQLLGTLERSAPKKFERYFEPFLGGGAFFFRLAARRPSLKAILSDSNAELINCYLNVRDNVWDLVDSLGKHRNDKHHFYKVRETDPSTLSPIDRASRLIFLNKTCFNGLYRVNRKGQFNVPFGSYKSPRIIDQANLERVQKVLMSADISCASFDEVLRRAQRGDFIYLDPPYMPVSRTANFTSYTKGSFGEAEQRQLANTFASLDARGCHVMLSNSDSPLIRELYKHFHMETVLATRAINSKASGRGPVLELLIRNY